MKRLLLCGWLLWCGVFWAPAATRIIYVSQHPPAGAAQTGASWSTALPSLQVALGQIPVGNTQPIEIWVAKGTYYPCNRTGSGMDRSATFHVPSYVTIRGGFAGDETSPSQRLSGTNFTVLSGDIGLAMTNAVTDAATTNQLLQNLYSPFATNAPESNCQDNCYNVITCASVTNVVLDTLMICGGYAGNLVAGGTNVITALQLGEMSLPGADVNNPTAFPLTNIVAGGAILLTFAKENLSHPANEIALTVTNCFFLDNYAAGYGGAICVFGGNVVVQGSQFRDNWAGVDGGAIWDASAHSVIQGCGFSQNVSRESGGAVAYWAFNYRDTVSPHSPSRGEVLGLSSSEEGNLLAMLRTTATVSAKLAWKVYIANPAGGTVNALKNIFTLGDEPFAFAPLSDAATEGLGLNLAAEGLLSGIGPGDVVGAIGLLVSSVDIGTQIAMMLGVSPNDPFIKVWQNVSYWWNQVTSPVSWIEDIISLGKDYPTQDYQTELYRQSQLVNYNIQAPSILDQCTFITNRAGLLGGAVVMNYKNVQVQHGWFAYNYSACSGGALACSGWGVFKVADCALYGNSSCLGHSVAYNFGNALASYINCTIVNNASGATNGCAIGNELGADVKVFNSILWNNINGLLLDHGADIFTATPQTLTGPMLAQYNDAPPELQGNFVATCDISMSDIQSLGQLPTARKLFPGINVPEDTRGKDWEDDHIASAVYEADALGQAEAMGWVNIAAGNMVGEMYQNYSNGNISEDPGLGGVEGIIPANYYYAYLLTYGDGDLLTANCGLTDDIYGLPRGDGRISMGAVDFFLDDLNSPGYYNEIHWGTIGAADLIAERWTSLPMPALPACSSPPSDVPPAPGAVIYVNANVSGSSNSGTGTQGTALLPGMGTGGTGSDWANATTSLEAALAFGLPPGIQVWVAGGSYTAPAGGFKVPKGVRLYGGFAGTEGLASQRVPGTHATSLVGGGGRILTLLGDSATLDGFTFSGGMAQSGSPGGGAIYGANTNGPFTLRNCAFVRNQAPQPGGQGGGGVPGRGGQRCRLQLCREHGHPSRRGALPGRQQLGV